MFIYQILNIKNNKRYIGQSTQSDKQRLWEHKTYLKSNNHQNRHLQRAWNLYGPENFEMTILENADSLERLNDLEEFYISKFNTLNRQFGYNIRGGGNNRFIAEETKQKISKSKKGISVHTPESIEKIRESSRNRIHSNESKLKRSNKLKGFIWSDEVKNQWAKTHRKGKEYPIILDPNKNEYKVINMTQFCKLHNLHQQSMSRLVNEQLNHHHGWTIKEKSV
jgi:group I intron endonuclease